MSNVDCDEDSVFDRDIEVNVPVPKGSDDDGEILEDSSGTSD